MAGTMNQQQDEIVNAPFNSHISVIATPGAGKTTVLVNRVSYLLSNGIPPEQIRVATFSRQAATEVASRLAHGVKASTIHSYCLELAERYEPAVTTSRIRLANPCAWTRDGNVVPYLAEEHENIFGGPEGEFFTPDEHIFRLLRSMIERIDCNIEDPIIDKVSQYFLLDEFQDVDPIQFQVIKMIVNKYGTKIFVVGDRNQNIYGFRNSSSRFLDEISTLANYPCATFSMVLNYRSTPPIVDFCNQLLPSSELRSKSTRDVPGWQPRIAMFEEKADEIEYVAHEIVRIGGKESGLSDIAVLARTQRDAYNIAHKLTDMKLPNVIITGDSAPKQGQKRKLDSTKSKNTIQGQVTVGTIHASKGLEWRHVIVIGGSSDVKNIGASTEELKQERNILYVACSRAKDTLLLTSSKKSVNRFIFPVDESAYEIANDHPLCKRPMFGRFENDDWDSNYNRADRSVTGFIRNAPGEFFDTCKIRGVLPKFYPEATLKRVHNIHVQPFAGDLAHMYAATVERVFYRQIIASLASALDIDTNKIRMLDNFANRCFLWVKSYAAPFAGNHPTEDEIESLVRERAAEFEVPLEAIEIHDEKYQLPAYCNTSTSSESFDGAMERIKDSYKRYIHFDVDTTSVEKLRTISDVAVCAHLAFSPPKTHLVHANLHLNDLKFDKNLGLFACTEAVAKHCVERFISSKPMIDKEGPIYLTAESMLREYGLSVDVDLSTPSLRGVADVLIGDMIIDLKCSNEQSGVQATWVLQLLIYAALARVKGIPINRIAIYNPIQGYFWETPITDWQSHEELLRRVNAQISGASRFAC